MQRIREVLERLRSIDPSKMAVAVVENSGKLQELIIELNTEDQLFNKGIDSEGNSLGIYRPFTVLDKRERGVPVPDDLHITLFDTGVYYGSHRVEFPNANEILIVSDPIRGDTNLFDEFGEQIKGLTDESIQKLREFILPALQRSILNFALTGRPL